MSDWNPSDELFRTRIKALVDNLGIDKVARRFRKSKRTIKRWPKGETRPSKKVKRRVVRSGRKYTGSVSRGRDSSGRFSVSQTIYNPSVVNRERSAQNRARDRRRRAIQEARTPSEVARAESLPEDADRDAFLSLDRLLLARPDLSDEFYDDDPQGWAAWRANYNVLKGSV